MERDFVFKDSDSVSKVITIRDKHAFFHYSAPVHVSHTRLRSHNATLFCFCLNMS